jgi:poly(hydroxyalkanoate) depolymerase family esterase
MAAAARMGPAVSQGTPTSSHLREIVDFGSNPGALRMFSHAPEHVPAGSALVVVLHGCTQTAGSYDHGAGWSTLADRYGFTLLLPEQQHSNNPKGCFNWFQRGDIQRGRGEALSIRQMVAKMVHDHDIDRRRVFVTGLSAGGAMTSVMLATYPDVFAGGAIVAGLPYGAANNVQEAFESMFKCPPRPARAWGDLVRDASRHAGPWPRVSVWHGGADAIVIPSNAGEIIKQWTDVHGLSGTPTFSETVAAYPRQVWRNAAGEDVIEAYAIPSMSHGTPLAVGDGDEQCGAAGAFLLEVGISSSYHIAKFWGLTDRRIAPEKQRLVEITSGHPAGKEAFEELRNASAEPADVPRSSSIDLSAVITDALKAAGLMR